MVLEELSFNPVSYSAKINYMSTAVVILGPQPGGLGSGFFPLEDFVLVLFYSHDCRNNSNSQFTNCSIRVTLLLGYLI